MGGIFMSSIRAASTLAAGSLLFGIVYNVVSWPATIAAFVLTLSALYCLGMLFASLFLMYGREAWHMANALQEPVYLAQRLLLSRARHRFLGGHGRIGHPADAGP